MCGNKYTKIIDNFFAHVFLVTLVVCATNRRCERKIYRKIKREGKIYPNTLSFGCVTLCMCVQKHYMLIKCATSESTARRGNIIPQ